LPLTPYTIEQFGGLNVQVDPLEVGATGATSIQDVDLDRSGMVRTRPGRDYVDADDSATFSDNISRVISPNVQGTGQPYVRQLAASATKLAEYLGGTVSTATVTGTGAWVDLMNIGGATDLVQDQTGLRAWDPVSHTLGAAIAGTPKSGYLGYKPNSSRIVIAGADMSALHADRVNFLDPGATTFTSTNWVSLEPGRERITGVTTVGELVFVFKESRMYVFYGESTDADGQPIFNYRPVNLGDRIRPRGSEGGGPPGRFGSDGQYAYFVATRGVYRTAGGPPELISGALTPIFRGEVTAITGFDDANTFVCATQDRLYVSGAGANATLVYEKATGQWSVYSFMSTAMAAALNPRSVYTVAASRRLALLSPSYTTDLGSAISWSYASGKYPLADPGLVWTTQESCMDGFGTVTLRLDSDLYSNQSASATLGTSPTVAEGWPANVDQEGRWMQHTLSGSGVAQVNRLTHYLRSVKPAGVR
jgi:hypothetical protein